jgi:superfamily I DNA/RNA helicase
MLTEEQLAAVDTTDPQVGVMSGAGTGKTTVIVARIRHLLGRGVDPKRIAVFTFTRAAARELRERLGADASGMHVGTFHSIALEHMRDQPQVLGEEESRAMSDLAVGMVGAKGSLSSWHKIICNGTADPKHADVVGTYQSLLEINGAIDYSGMLSRLLTMIAGGVALADVTHVMVDEAQDTDSTQWRIVDRLVDSGAELFCVGDIKQTLYTWRGADYNDFLKRCPALCHITESFRNPPDVARVANRVIEESGMQSPPLRTTKTINGLSLTSDPVSVTVKNLMDDELFSPSDIAVLCRTNRTVGFIQEELARDSIQCSDLSGERAQLESIKPLLTFVCYPSRMNAQNLTKAWPFTTLDLPPFLLEVSGVSDTARHIRTELWRDGLCIKPTVRAILSALSHALNKDAVELWNTTYGDWDPREALQDLATSSLTPKRSSGVTVCTTHQAKGLEYPATIVVCEPISKLDEEDYRVFYVALTRCQERCVVTDTGRTPSPLMQIVREECLRARMQS